MEKFDKDKLLERAKKGIQKTAELVKKQGWKKFDDKPCAMHTMDVEGKMAAMGVSEVNYSM